MSNFSQTLESPEPMAMRRPKLPSTIFGTLIFVVTEIMFFMALVSAFIIIRGNNPGFAIPEGIVLPVAMTGLNTLILMVSGFLLYQAGKRMAEGRDILAVRSLLLATMATAITFVGIQGYEWVRLIRYGLTLTNGIFGACFYLLIGSHGLHALGAIGAMIYVLGILDRGKLRLDHIQSLQAFWFFVVGVWPLLYWLVYF
jgi:heme/copper-type cytochrome/quinol oxidase subunit 3